MWVKDLETRPDMSIKVERQLHDMRISGRGVGVRSTEQPAGIINIHQLCLNKWHRLKCFIMHD